MAIPLLKRRQNYTFFLNFQEMALKNYQKFVNLTCQNNIKIAFCMFMQQIFSLS